MAQIRLALSAPSKGLRKPDRPLIGRELELKALIDMARRPGTRVLSITGPGGVGKTRLALELGRRMAAEFLNGVIFVDLGHVETSDELVDHLGDQLGISFKGQAAPVEQVADWLEHFEALVIFDNFEQLRTPAGRVLAHLAESDSSRFLVTSRQAIHIEMESAYRLVGLQTDGQDSARSPARDLFIASAQRFQPDFVPSTADRSAISEICKHLDGLPLAIEMAAAWTRTLSTGEILSEIQNNILFLDAGSDSHSAQKGSLKAAFDYSWGQLNPRLKDILRRLVVFRSAFDLQAAKAVAQAERADLLELLNCSLIFSRTELGTFGILQVLAEQIRLQGVKSSVFDMAIADHARFMTAWLVEKDDSQIGSDRLTILEILGWRQADVHLALETVLARESLDLEAVAPFREPLFQFYHARGWYRRGASLFSRLVTRLDARAPDSAEATLQWSRAAHRLGNILSYLGEYSQAVSYLDKAFQLGSGLFTRRELAGLEISLSQALSFLDQPDQSLTHAQAALAIYRELGNERAVSVALRHIANTQMTRGRFQEAKELLIEARNLANKLDDEPLIGKINNVLGNLLADVGDYAGAHSSYEAAMVIFRKHEAKFSLALSLNNLATLENARGNFERARSLLNENIEISQEIGDEIGVAIAYGNLGVGHLFEGQYEAALLAFRTCVRLERQAESPYFLSYALWGLGETLIRLNRLEEGEKCLLEGLEMSQARDLSGRILYLLRGFGLLFQYSNRLANAYRLTYFFSQHPEAVQEVRDLCEKTLVELRESFPAVQQAHIAAALEPLAIGDLVDEILG